MRKILCILAVISILSLTGCKTSKPTSTSDYDGRSLTLPEHFDALASSYGEWQDVNIPLKLELTEPQKFSISGRVTMVRDQNIMLSLRFLGMEVVNMYVTTDSIFATDKIHKYFLAEDLKSFMSDIPMTITDVQNMLLGQAFLLEKGTLKTSMRKQVELTQIDEYWAILPKKKFNDVEYAFGVTMDDRLRALTVTRGDTTPLQCIYDDAVQSPAGIIAQSVGIIVTTSSKRLNANIKWNADAAKWNTGSSREWKAPKGYKRIYGDALLKMLSEQ